MEGACRERTVRADGLMARRFVGSGPGVECLLDIDLKDHNDEVGVNRSVEVAGE